MKNMSSPYQHVYLILFVAIIFTQSCFYNNVHAIKPTSSSSFRNYKKLAVNEKSSKSVLIEVKENGVIRDGVRVVKNAFTKKCDAKCIDDVVANGDKNCGNPVQIIKHALVELNSGGVFKLLYTLLVKSFFYAKNILTHTYHLDELLRDEYRKLRETEVFEKMENVASKNRFVTFMMKKKKHSMFELMIEPAVKTVTEKVQKVCDLLPEIGFSIGVTVNINLQGICNFGVAHMISKFSESAVKWSRDALAKHTKMHFVQSLFFEPIDQLNKHFNTLIGKNIIQQEKKLCNALKHMMEKNIVTDSVRTRLMGEFDLIDEYFSVDTTDGRKLDKLDVLTKLDRVVLKSTLLFDSDYINDLSSSYIKKKIHDWALHEIRIVTSPLANVLTGELSERKRELEKRLKEEPKKPRNWGGRWGAKKVEEEEKKRDRELLASYDENLKTVAKYENFVFTDGTTHYKEKKEAPVQGPINKPSSVDPI